MPELSDEELIEAYRRSRPGAAADALINQLFQRYHSRVALWCFRITGNRESAADLAQDVFLKVFRNLESFRGDARFSTWLYSVTRNHCFTEVKSRASRQETTFEPLADEFADTSADPHENCGARGFGCGCARIGARRVDRDRKPCDDSSLRAANSKSCSDRPRSASPWRSSHRRARPPAVISKTA